MRRVAVAGLLALAVLAGCGSGSKSTVTLDLPGARGNANGVACGKTEPFFRFPRPGRIAVTGRVRPAPGGRWKVKVKVKECSGRAFATSAETKIVGQPSGRYDGSVTVRRPGAYSIRARLSKGGTGQSPKLYVRVG